jgi:thiol-disulfide isomerase/thioredoxin
MPPESDADRRTFLKAAAIAFAAGRFNMSNTWQRPLHDLGGVGVADELSSLSGATAWINSPALTEGSLEGKVVLVQFCTFTCINWLRTLPYIRAWADAYKNAGLVVIGAHTPEFPFEKNVANVRRVIGEMKVSYPIAVDSEYRIWRGFRNQYWPALYLLDTKGRVRYHQFGEGKYAESERMIQQLLKEAGARGIPEHPTSVDGRGIEAPADWSDLKSAENYVGSERTENFASPGGAATGRRPVYALPQELSLNEWALEGDWTVEPGFIALNEPNGRIAYRFHGRDLHLVMGPPSAMRPVRFRVLLDGLPPAMAHGADVDPEGKGVATEQRLHQLIRQPKPIDDRVFQIEFLDQGVEAFSFTFG